MGVKEGKKNCRILRGIAMDAHLTLTIQTGSVPALNVLFDDDFYNMTLV